MPRLILPAMPAVPTQPSVGNLQDWAASVKSWADTVRGKIEVWSSGVAALNGSATIPFNVADATSDSQAVALGQVLQVAPVGATDAIASGGGTATATTAALVAPCNGMAIVFARCTAVAYDSGVSFTISSSLSGLVKPAPTISNFPESPGWAYLPMTTGQSSTFTASMTDPSTNFGVLIFAFFVPSP